MSLITFFSALKPFTNPHTAVSQCNAIQSWKRLGDVGILLLGEEQGIADAAVKFGVRHLPQVARNPNGTPLISSMFKLARENSDSPLLCIINADIVLMSDFLQAAKQIASLEKPAGGMPKKFVLISQRWDMDIPAPIEFIQGWEERMRSMAHEKGRLHRPTGSDFFLFPRGCYVDVPDFAIGRAGWDNWMIYKARMEGWPVIDCTQSMMIVHQNHDYSHLPGARPHYNHPDTQVNTRLAGGQAATRYTTVDSTHAFINGRLVHPKTSRARFMRGLELFLRRAFFFLPDELVESIARPRRWNKRIREIFGKWDS
jgi:hypothetical protein